MKALCISWRFRIYCEPSISIRCQGFLNLDISVMDHSQPLPPGNGGGFLEVGGGLDSVIKSPADF